MRSSRDDRLARRIVSTQAEPAGFGSGLASGAGQPQFVVILVPGRVVAAISRHGAE
jgi:hypothetical protein